MARLKWCEAIGYVSEQFDCDGCKKCGGPCDPEKVGK